MIVRHDEDDVRAIVGGAGSGQDSDEKGNCRGELTHAAPNLNRVDCRLRTADCRF
jgi:hypothetical protein